MSTIRVAVKAVMFAGALLAAQATLASDVTTERQQVARPSAAPGAERPDATATKPCYCSHATPKRSPAQLREEEELRQLRQQNG